MLSFVRLQFFHITLLPVCRSSWEPFWLEGKSWFNPLGLNPSEEIWVHSCWRWDGWDIHLFVVRTPIVHHGLLAGPNRLVLYNCCLLQEETLSIILIWKSFNFEMTALLRILQFDWKGCIFQCYLSLRIVGHLVAETGNIAAANILSNASRHEWYP